MSKPTEECELSTVLQDARFNNMNVANWCFQSFVDYLKCDRLLGSEHKSCEQFLRIYQTICPNDWVRRWKEQIEVGTFPVDLPPRRRC